MQNKNGFIDLLEGIAARSPIKEKEGDYKGPDGLIYCGCCKTAKQVKVEINGRKLTPFCMCECEKEKYEKEKAEDKARALREQIERNRRAGFPEVQMQTWTFEKDDRANAKISDICQRYVENFPKMKAKGKGLMFLGGFGTGKTFLAACIANALLDEGYSVLMTNFPRLINTIHGMREGKQEYIDSLNKYSLLIIDDLGVERQSEYVAEIVQNIIDSRYRAGLPLIITSNLSPKDFTETHDIAKSRLYSRISEMCLPLVVNGVDRRKANSAARDSELAELLGI
jgi:DNA replication protein DnaC